MGALLMILSIAIDPFAQQIPAFPSRSVQAHNGTAKGVSAWETVENINSEYDLSPSMNTAILNGIVQTNQHLEPQCLPGNYQYPDFVTLGFCSRCQDIASRLVNAVRLIPQT